MKRSFAFLLAMLMALALVACAQTPAADGPEPAGGGNAAGAQPADDTPDAAEPADADAVPTVDADMDEPADDTTEDDGWGGLQFPLSTEGDTFRFFRGTTPALTYFYDSLNEVPQFIVAEQRTGVHIDWEVVADFGTQFPLMIASGDWADCASSWTKGGDLATYASDDIVLELSDLIDAYCPNYNKRRTEDAAIARDTSTDEGYLLAFYNIKQSIQGSWMGLWARADWVEAWGGGPIKTYADWEDYLTWALANHSDTLTIPYIFNGTGLDRYLLCGYDLSSDWLVENGEVKYSPLQPAMRDYVQMCHDWYEKGLINDYAFSGERLFFDDYAQGGCAMATTFQSWWSIVPTYTEDPNFGMQAVTPPMLDANHHRRIETGTSPMTRNESLSAYLFTSCQKPEILCQWFDQWYSDAGSIEADFGIEGESFYYNEDGVPTFSDDILHNNEGYGYSTAWLKYIDTNIPRYFHWTREQAAMPAKAMEAPPIWDEGWVDELTYPEFATRSGEEGERYASIMSDVETTLNETVPKFIRGDRPMSEWDAFVEQLTGMNVEEARQIQQAAYERYMAHPVD